MENIKDQQSYNLQPAVGSSYGMSWEVMKKNFLELLLVTVIYFAVSIPAGISRIGIEASGFGVGGVLLGLFSLAYTIFVIAPMAYGMAYVFLKVTRGEKFDVADVFTAFHSQYLQVILANLLTMAIVLAGIILLIIPGIIFACKLAFVPYLVMDKKMEAIDAVKTSWSMTNGHALTIFLMGLLAFPIVIVGFILLIVGVIPAGIWIEGAFAAIYLAVDKKLNNHAEEEPVMSS
ncbi:MAG: hypothetical protein V2I62_02575 [Bacteroidales bacterium]|jgi:uncharacterized membrane protein|nr:hypothetical protein [Bacteroidales bacterium]